MDIDRNSFSGVVVFFVVSVWNCATFAAIFYDVDCEEVTLADRVNPKRSTVSRIGLSKCSSFKLVYLLDPYHLHQDSGDLFLIFTQPIAIQNCSNHISECNMLVDRTLTGRSST